MSNKGKIGVLPSSTSYMTAQIALNPNSDARDLAVIIEKLELVTFLIPIEESEATDFIVMLQNGLEEIRVLFNKGMDINEDVKLKNSYIALKRDALMKIEAYESDEVQSLLKENSSEDKSFILDYDPNNENLGDLIFSNTIALYDVFVSKYNEISELAAEIPQGA